MFDYLCVEFFFTLFFTKKSGVQAALLHDSSVMQRLHCTVSILSREKQISFTIKKKYH